MQLILTPPPKVIVILMKISINCGNAATTSQCIVSATSQFHNITILQRVDDTRHGKEISKSHLCDFHKTGQNRNIFYHFFHPLNELCKLKL